MRVLDRAFKFSNPLNYYLTVIVFIYCWAYLYLLNINFHTSLSVKITKSSQTTEIVKKYQLLLKFNFKI